MPLPSDRLTVKIAGYLRARAQARRIGDLNLARSITADLQRLGWRDDTVGLPATTQAAALPETTVGALTSPRRRGRPPKPRPVPQDLEEDPWPAA